MTKYILLASTFALGYFVKAQDNVEIDVPGNREIEPAFRIVESPKIIDTVLPYSEVEYPLLSLKYETSIQLERIEAASVKLNQKLPQLYNSYVKIGIGSTLMPLGEIYYNSTRSRKYIYGAHLKHLSSFGNINGYAPAQFDRTGLNLFGGINEQKYTVRGDFNLNTRGLHWYGFENENADRDSIHQRFTETGTQFSFASHAKDSASVNYKVGLAYANFHDHKSDIDSLAAWRGRENYVGVTSSFWYKMGKETFATDFNIRYNGYRYGEKDNSLSAVDTAIFRNNTIVNLKPSITTFLQDNKFKAQVGVDITLDAVKGKSRVYIYPQAEVKYSMFNDILIPYAGIKGGLKQTTFKSLSLENDFILSNVNLRNEHNALNAFIGIKGTLTKRIGFNASASFAHYKNKALFVTDTLYARGNQFRVIYDTMNITTLEGSLSYQMTEKLKIDAIGRFYSYNARNNTYAWNLPQFQLILRGNYNLYDKFIVNLDMTYEGGRKALVYEKWNTDTEGVTEENGQLAKSLGFIADVNLGVEYRYNKRISAFVQLNNLAAQRYKRWYNYPVQGFQVMGGFTFRF